MFASPVRHRGTPVRRGTPSRDERDTSAAATMLFSPPGGGGAVAPRAAFVGAGAGAATPTTPRGAASESKAAPATPPNWVDDKDVKECQGCESSFSMWNRKHHCRACGNVFCNDCTQFRSPIPVYGIFNRVRVCKQCVSRFSGLSKGGSPGVPGASPLSALKSAGRNQAAMSPAPGWRSQRGMDSPDSAVASVASAAKAASGALDQFMSPPPRVHRVTRDNKESLSFFSPQAPSAASRRLAFEGSSTPGPVAATVALNRASMAGAAGAASPAPRGIPPHAHTVDAGPKVRARRPMFRSPAHRRLATRLSAESAPLWVPDKFIKACQSCQQDFSLFRRRHHCRVCGRIYCDDCTDHVASMDTLHKDELLRVCYECLQEADEEQKREDAEEALKAGAKASADASAEAAMDGARRKIAFDDASDDGAGAKDAAEGAATDGVAMRDDTAAPSTQTTTSTTAVAKANDTAAAVSVTNSLEGLPAALLVHVAIFLPASDVCSMQTASRGVRQRLIGSAAEASVWHRGAVNATAELSAQCAIATSGLVRHAAGNVDNTAVSVAVDAAEGSTSIAEAAAGTGPDTMRRLCMLQHSAPRTSEQSRAVLAEYAAAVTAAGDDEAATAAIEITPKQAVASWVVMHDVHIAADTNGSVAPDVLRRIGMPTLITMLRNGLVDELPEGHEAEGEAGHAAVNAGVAPGSDLAVDDVSVDDNASDDGCGEDSDSEAENTGFDPVMDCLVADADEEVEAEAEAGAAAEAACDDASRAVGDEPAAAADAGEVDATESTAAPTATAAQSPAAAAGAGARTPARSVAGTPDGRGRASATRRGRHHVHHHGQQHSAGPLLPRPRLVAGVAAAGTLMNLAMMRMPGRLTPAAPVLVDAIKVLTRRAREASAASVAGAAGSRSIAITVATSEAALRNKLLQYCVGALWNLSNCDKEACEAVGECDAVGTLLELMMMVDGVSASDGFATCFVGAGPSEESRARCQLYCAGSLTNIWKLSSKFRHQVLTSPHGVSALLKVMRSADFKALRAADEAAEEAAASASGDADTASFARSAAKKARRRRLSATSRPAADNVLTTTTTTGGTTHVTVFSRLKRQLAVAMRECVRGCEPVAASLRLCDGLKQLAEFAGDADRRVGEAVAAALQDCSFQDAPAREALIDAGGAKLLAQQLAKPNDRLVKLCAGILMNCCASGPSIARLVGSAPAPAAPSRADADAPEASAPKARVDGKQINFVRMLMQPLTRLIATQDTSETRNFRSVSSQLQATEMCIGALSNCCAHADNIAVIRAAHGPILFTKALLSLPTKSRIRENIPPGTFDAGDIKSFAAVSRDIVAAVTNTAGVPGADRAKQFQRITTVITLLDDLRLATTPV